MKCIQNITNSATYRTTNEYANTLVNKTGGWRYVSKSEWKSTGRKVMGRGKEKQFQVNKPKMESNYNRFIEFVSNINSDNTST